MSYGIDRGKLVDFLSQIQKGNRIIQRKLNTPINRDNKFDGKLHIICLYYTILDLSDNVVNLLECNKPIAIPIIVRSISEAVVDIANGIKDDNYLMQIKKLGINRDKKWLDTAAMALENITHDLSELDYDIKLLKDIPDERILIKDKYINAGMGNRYKNDYYYLSDHAHNTYDALQHRHSRITNGKQKISRSYTLSPENIRISIAIMIDYVLIGVLLIHKYLKAFDNHNLTNIKNTHSSLCAKLYHYNK